MATIDHKAEALRLLAATPVGDSPDGAWGAAIAAEAQVHATLALAEQQRIANLIALAADERDAFARIGFGALAESLPGEDPWGSHRIELLADIREGLGLS